MKSPFAFSFKAFAAAILLVAFAATGFAQTNASGTSTAGAQASTAPINIVTTNEASQPLAHTSADVKQTIKSYTAPTAPSVYGSVGGAGCPAIEGASGSVFVANGSKTWAVELPGCMGLQLAALLNTMVIGDDGQISRKTAAMLEAQCDFPQYRGALKRMGLTLGGRAWACAQDADVAATGYSSDPLIARRQREAGR